MAVEHRETESLMQAALGAGEDPSLKARGLKALHRDWAEGLNIPGLVRPVVARSWQRAGALHQDIRPLDTATLRTRREGNEQLTKLLPMFKDRLLSLAAQAENQLVISDEQGYVLWVLGPSPVRRRSDGIGFVDGARWREADVGTNGIGAAIAERSPVQIFGPEHAREEQHSWVCTSAPVSHPLTGTLTGTITLAGSYRTAHPHSLALVASVAKQAEELLRQDHAVKMQRLTEDTVLPAGDYLLTDEQGAVASARGYRTRGKIQLPSTLTEGEQWIAGVGGVTARRTSRGWILERTQGQSMLEIEFSPLPQAIMHTPAGSTRIDLSAKHAQILTLLAAYPQGVPASQLAQLWPAGTPGVTIRAEVSRLRTKLRGVIASRPYRLLVPVL